PPPTAGRADGHRKAELDGATRGAAQRALARGHGLLLPPYARLLVVLALAKLGEDTGLLALLLEATDRALDGLVVLDPNPCHVVTSPPPRRSGPRARMRGSPRGKGGTMGQKG